MSKQIKTNSLTVDTKDHNVYCVKQDFHLFILNEEWALCDDCIIFYITRLVLNGGKVTDLIELKNLHVVTRRFVNAPLGDFCDECHKKLTTSTTAADCDNCKHNDFGRVLNFLKRHHLILHGVLDFEKPLKEFSTFFRHLEIARKIFSQLPL